MKLILVNRQQLIQVGQFLVDELDSLIARIRGAWNVEHKDDDTHGNVHSDSIATGRLTFSGIATAEVNQARVDNFNPGGIDTAAILRISGTGSSGTILITGIQVPRDEKEQVLDGRVLVLENVTSNIYVELSFEDTQSAVYNRFTLPYNVDAGSTRIRIAPKSLQILIYNATTSRWIVHTQSNDNMIATYSGSTSDNDFAPSGFKSCSTLCIDKTASGKTISGFDTTDIPINSRKRIVNVGIYAFEILHANTGSLEANRVYCPGQVRYRLHPRESVELYRQVEGGWRLVSSGKADQWVDVAYSSSNFTSNTGTWTVDSGDQITYCYHLDGNKMTVAFRILTTDVSGSPTALNIAIPGGRTAARTIRNLITITDAGATGVAGIAEVTAGGTTIACIKFGGVAFTNTTSDNTNVLGEITFMVLDESGTISELHSDVAHGDTAHSDVDHSDIAHADTSHGDTHSDTSHSDISHSDVAHVDTTSHSDTHSDTAHADTAHSDVVHGDTAHQDSTSPHVDHNDVGHADVPSHHVDAAHVDTAHSDTAHSDTAHSDSHSDTSTHSDTAHSDVAHVDAGHGDSHSDTAPHTDVAHADVSHGDTAHADSVHVDVGPHYDTSHVDI